MLNIAQLFGDYVLLLGMVILLVKILLTKSCAGKLFTFAYLVLYFIVILVISLIAMDTRCEIS